MANTYSAAGALVAATAQAVTVRTGVGGVWVINRTAASEIWARLDGIAATVAGAGCFCVLGSRNFPTPAGSTVTVSLISATTPNYSVEGAVPVIPTAGD